MKRKTKRVDLRIDRDTFEVIESIAKGGLLGKTRDEVVSHVLREYLFRAHLRAALEAGAAAPEPKA